MDTLKIFFKKWRDIISFRKYDEWCETDEAKKAFYEIKQEEEDEKEYARQNDMDSIHWCWNCKYSNCEEH
jgi:hypothetical protein